MNRISYEDLSVILPTLNEGRNISMLLDTLIRDYPKLHIIVIDDSSTDNTAACVGSKNYQYLNFIERGGERGLTGSIIDGINKTKTPFVVVMDSDFQHPPEKISDIYEVLKKGADLVVMYRTDVKDWKVHRKFMSCLADFLGNLRLYLGNNPPVKDLLSGYFGGKTEKILNIINRDKNRFEKRGYKFLFDFIKGVRNGEVNIAEISYSFSNRLFGTSKIGFRHIIYFIRSLFI